jgi:hypothetical protein
MKASAQLAIIAHLNVDALIQAEFDEIQGLVNSLRCRLLQIGEK